MLRVRLQHFPSTERDFFQGALEFLPLVKNCVSLPVLRKDFLFEEYQIYESRAHGTDAILLIASLLSRDQAGDLLHLSHDLGLDVLFEVHTAQELDMALRIGATVIGINNRDLGTLQIRLDTTLEMLDDIPAGITVVSESGITERSHVERLLRSRVDAVLIGTAFMERGNIDEKFRELFAVEQPVRSIPTSEPA